MTGVYERDVKMCIRRLAAVLIGSTLLTSVLALNVHAAEPGEFDDLAVNTPGEAPPLAPSELTWVCTGGPPGGIGYDIRMRPDNPDVMYVTDTGAGIFKSTNGGQDWFPVNNGIGAFPDVGTPVLCATVDPHDYDTVWIGTRSAAHIYRSTDGGQTWERRDNGIIPIQGEHSVRGIAIDPLDGNIMYAGLEAGVGVVGGIVRSGGEVYKSTDAGSSWIRIWSGDSLARYVWIDPRNTQRIYVSTGIFNRHAVNADEAGQGGGLGILRSDDAGETWTILDEDNGLGGLFIPSMFMHPENPDMLLVAITDHVGNPNAPGVYVTRDGGDAWQMLVPHNDVEAVEIAMGNPNVWYAAGKDTCLRSDDAGTTWQEFVMRTADRGFGFPIDIQVDPRDPYRVFVNGCGGGTMMSTDGGSSWVDASAGYTGARIWGLYVAREDDLTIIAGTKTSTLRSTDGGRTWIGTQINGPVGRIASYQARDGSGTHILASGPFSSGVVFHSTDSGFTWQESLVIDIRAMIDAGLLGNHEFIARALAVAPSDPNIVYIGYSARACAVRSWVECFHRSVGFFRSQDSGYTWQQVEGLPFDNASILTLAVTPDDPKGLYAATTMGPYLSRDGGDTWSLIESLDSLAGGMVLPEGQIPSVSVMTVDPFDSQTIYAGSLQSALWRSDDGGQSWVHASVGLEPNGGIADILPDPGRPGVVYVSTRTSGVFVSTDRAQTWQRLGEGFPELEARQLALSDDGTVLVVGSQGVYRLDLTGDGAGLVTVAGDKP